LVDFGTRCGSPSRIDQRPTRTHAGAVEPTRQQSHSKSQADLVNSIHYHSKKELKTANPFLTFQLPVIATLKLSAMKKETRTSVFVFFLSTCLFLSIDSIGQTYFNYPQTPVRPIVDTIFNRVVTDNYRWLEDVNNPEVQNWLKQQADLTNNYLAKIPGSNRLYEEYQKLDNLNAVDIGFIMRKAGRYFYIKTQKGENVGKLYYRQGERGKEVLLFDPYLYQKQQSLSAPVTFWYVPSNDGKNVALSLTDNGKGDIRKVKFVNVDTRSLLTDSLYPVSSPQAWTPDGKGLIYGELQTTDQLSANFFLNIPLKIHKIGESVKDDRTLLSGANNPKLKIEPLDLLSVNYSLDNKYLVLELWSGPQEQIRRFYAQASSIESPQVDWQPLTIAEDQVSQVLVCKGNAYLLSRKGAPNRKVMVLPLNGVPMSKAKTIVPESKQPIEYLVLCKDFLLIQKTNGINSIVEQYNLSNGELKRVNVPQKGSVSPQTYDGFTNDCVLWVNSWSQPTIHYDYDPLNASVRVNTIYPKIVYPGTNELIVEETEVKSYDGTLVPLSLVYNKNIKRDGSNITYLEGYGSYGSSSLPWLDIKYLPLLNKSVIVAHAHPRGGGEKGYAWHMGGFKSTKPNTWKDFIASAEFLIRERYTSPEHLIGEGTSAGGILIGRAMTERPDLFAVAINNVPVSNPVRGENRPNGALDAQEFGTVKDSAELSGLVEMDAYLHVKQSVKYPAVLAVGGINDTRVPVWQPAKLVAALQHASASNKPILLMVNYNSGHWSDEKFVTYRNYANIYSLALWQAGQKDFLPEKN
jgi:prolyl oligopeptidase